MIRRLGAAAPLLATLVALAGCDLRPPHVVLTIRDPDGVAGGAASIAVGVSSGSLGSKPLGGHLFPVRVGVTVDAPGTYPIFVEARDAQGAVVARGRAEADFPASSTGTATVDLRAACASDAECDDDLFCDGAETCDGAAEEFGFCVRGAAPCSQPPYPCVTLECVEALRACATTVDHTLCSATTLPDGTTQPRYCDSESGCVQGQACQTAADCQDGSVCNGAEVCAYHHCSAGPPFSADDGDPCTLDFCVEPSGAQHLADAALDGAACTLATEPGTTRVCALGQCVLSTCGDGVVDARGEACDDGNADPNDGCDGCRETRWMPTVVTGLGRSGGDPLLLALHSPFKPAVGPAGELYVADGYSSRIWRIAGGLVTLAAGLGTDGFSGDGGPATAAQLDRPESLAVDGAGTLYIADRRNFRIRRVDARTGVITTIAGGGSSTADGIPAIAAQISYIGDLAVDGVGNVYYVDTIRYLLRRVEAGSGLVFTVAGNEAATEPGDGGPALDAALAYPRMVAVAGADTLFVSEDCGLRKVVLEQPFDPTSGTISRAAGNATCLTGGDGVHALDAGISVPIALAVDGRGDVFFADSMTSRVRRLSAATGLVSYVAGNGGSGPLADGTAALSAPLGEINGLAVDGLGALFVTELSRDRVLRVLRPSADPADWTVARLAGGTLDFASVSLGPATTMPATNCAAAASDSAIYFGDPFREVIWKAELGQRDDPLSWRVSLVAGGGASAAEDVPATSAALHLGTTCALALDASGSLYVAVPDEHRVRRVIVDPSSPRAGRIETVAGNGTPVPDVGDGGPALQASFEWIDALAVDSAGRLFVVADNHVRLVTPVDPASPSTWTIQNAVGTGAVGYTGDGGPAAAATFECATRIAASSRHLFVTDSCSAVVRAVPLSGDPSTWTIFTAAGNGSDAWSGDGGPATAAALGAPFGVGVAPNKGVLYLADPWNEVVRSIDVGPDDPAAWTISSLTSPGVVHAEWIGDGGPAAQAVTSMTQVVAVAPGGQLFVGGGNSIRRVLFPDQADPSTWTITTVVGQVDPEGDGSTSTGALGTPSALASFDPLRLAVADGVDGRVRWVDLGEGQVRTVAGYPDGPLALLGQTTPARYARLFGDAAGIAFDPRSQSFFLTDSVRHTLHRLQVKDPARPWGWSLETLAGGAGRTGHLDGALADSKFFGPAGLAFDAQARTLYVSEVVNHDVRAIRVDDPAAADCVTTVAGTSGRFGFLDGAADAALFQRPRALALGPGQSLYVADAGNHRVRRVDLAAKTVGTVLGNGAASSSGVGAPASAFPSDSPAGLAVDASGNLFVSSRDTLRLVTASPSGHATGQGSVLTLYSPDLRPPGVPEAKCLSGLLLAAGDAGLYALDECQGLLLRLDRAKVAP